MAKVEGWREVWIQDFVCEKSDRDGGIWRVEARVDSPRRAGDPFEWVVSTIAPRQDGRQRSAWGETPTRERAMELALAEAQRHGVRPA